jgi:hypothetical protein
MPKKITINSCTQCPHHTSERDYTHDSFETGYKWHCSQLDKYVRRLVDWNDKEAYIPEECPLDD